MTTTIGTSPDTVLMPDDPKITFLVTVTMKIHAPSLKDAEDIFDATPGKIMRQACDSFRIMGTRRSISKMLEAKRRKS